MLLLGGLVPIFKSMTESKLFDPGVLDGVLYTSIILDLRELRGVCFCVYTRVCGCELVDGSCREDT